MAESPDTFTDKYFVDYSNAIGAHTFLVRADDGTSIATVETAITTFLGRISALFALTTVTALRVQAMGNNFSFPVASPLVGVTFGSAGTSIEANATAASWVGRSATGRRVRLSVFGFKLSFSDYRLTSLESADVTQSIAVLSSTTGVFQAIDASDPVWYNYIDIKPNDYWVRKARG